MRAFEGQHSDAAPIKRSREQKALLLRQLREQLAGLRPTVAATLRRSLEQRIADLERELDGRGAPTARAP